MINCENGECSWTLNHTEKTYKFSVICQMKITQLSKLIDSQRFSPLCWSSQLHKGWNRMNSLSTDRTFTWSRDIRLIQRSYRVNSNECWIRAARMWRRTQKIVRNWSDSSTKDEKRENFLAPVILIALNNIYHSLLEMQQTCSVFISNLELNFSSFSSYEQWVKAKKKSFQLSHLSFILLI